jgi:uncharacterized protein (UPF0261 family)
MVDMVVIEAIMIIMGTVDMMDMVEVIMVPNKFRSLGCIFLHNR